MTFITSKSITGMTSSPLLSVNGVVGDLADWDEFFVKINDMGTVGVGNPWHFTGAGSGIIWADGPQPSQDGTVAHV